MGFGRTGKPHAQNQAQKRAIKRAVVLPWEIPMTDKAPLYFEARLGGLFPANAVAENAMQEVQGRVRVTMTGGKANQRRRSLYWAVAALVVPLLNDKHGMTLDEDDLHDISRDKLKLCDEVELPSGDIHLKRRSTKNAHMSEPERAEYTTKALALWSTWTGVPVETLRTEGDQ
jgi:hypothetical protein